jgi:formylmethanofuran:tetrahydromethanopterin formyltransferase
VLAFAAVSFAQDGSKTASGEKVSVKYGETASTKSTRVKAKLVEIIEDSRCPEDVDCIWAGRVRIKMTVTTKKGAPVDIELSSDQQTSVDVGSYRLTLGEVGPKRRANATVTKADYVAEITIEKIKK